MPTPVINTIPNGKFQSPYLRLQAAGSDGSDGSTSGVHLRWELRRSLGENHLPKGNLASPSGSYPATGGFHKENDFVKIHRVPYVFKYPAIIDFENDVPERLTETGLVRSWEFDLQIKNITAVNQQTILIVRFRDVNQYDALRVTINPLTNPLNFIKQYTGVLEVEAIDKLHFAASLHMKMDDPGNTPPGVLRMETISVPDTITGEKFISCRTKFEDDIDPGNPDPLPIVDDTAFLQLDDCVVHKQMVDNIKYVRFDYENYYPAKISIETYEDFIAGANYNTTVQWEFLNEFSLAEDDLTVFGRLDNPSFQVNGNWPKYNDRNNPQTGAFTVKTQNYVDKWSASGGIKSGLQTYLTKSQYPANPTAVVKEKFDTSGQTFNPHNDASMELSYLEMLQFISMDFHLARMLGLGHIDTNVQGEQKFIYLSVYDTKAALEPGAAASDIRHFYMSLPTARQESKLPQAPVLNPVEYGIKIPAVPNPVTIPNANGYVPFEKLRFVSLLRQEQKIDRGFSEDFFPTEDFFCSADVTEPVFFGVEYRESSESTFRYPELSSEPLREPNDLPDYADPADLPEVTPIPADEDVTRPVFVHEETEEGQHVYAIYGINWFSRVSPISNQQATDVTLFPQINTLLPPSNLAVQLIQKENPLIFTTGDEQDKLEALEPGTEDNEILVRAEFQWNHVHIAAYQFKIPDPIRLADTVQVFFRENKPTIVKGKVLSLTDLPDNRVQVTVGPNQIYSTTPNSAGETITPQIIPGDEGKFASSLFTAAEKTFVVESISANGSGIVQTVILKKLVTNSVTENNRKATDRDKFLSKQKFESPKADDVFIIIENLSSESSWPNNLLVKTVQLVNFTTIWDQDGNSVPARTHEESVTEEDGTLTRKILGGIFEKATIAIDPPGPDKGLFKITFENNFQLADHPDTEVDWKGGTVRIKTMSGAIKVLDVWDIDNETGPTLIIRVFDSGFSNIAFNPVTGEGYDPIQTGLGKLVNFHPGYRAYFTEEPLVNFDQDGILPAQDQGTKETYMTVRSREASANMNSFLATPVILLAREIVEPVAPDEPVGPIFATRPDFYGKSTYTFDTVVNTTNGRKPFSLVFYRSNERTILDVLYKQETIADIMDQLVALNENAGDSTLRWRELVNVITDGSGLFNEFTGYRFPIPDNDDYVIPDPDPTHPPVKPFNGITPPGDNNVVIGTELIFPEDEDGKKMFEVVEIAITGAFLPLTEQPVLYNDIETGFVTSNRKPVLRDSNGSRLFPTDILYDPNPMVVKYVEGSETKVRFTDYTLDGSSLNIYFYYAQELSNNLQFSDPSPVAGPVRLVNSYPPQAPEIRKITTQLANPVTGDVTAVVFAINPYIESERITKVQIYRAANADDALNIRTMKLAKEEIIADPEAFEWIVTDDFSDEPIPLYGETLYYRLVAIREILNEEEQTERIPSLPSQLAVSSIVDVLNPAAPDISYSAGNLTAVSPVELPGVKLKWQKAAHNGKYYLYKMTSTGNWELLETIKTNDSLIMHAIGDLVKEDEDGNTIYHRFKVDVENASGLLNLEENPIVI